MFVLVFEKIFLFVVYVLFHVPLLQETILLEAVTIHHGDPQRRIDGIPGAMSPFAPFGSDHRCHCAPLGQYATDHCR